MCSQSYLFISHTGFLPVLELGTQQGSPRLAREQRKISDPQCAPPFSRSKPAPKSVHQLVPGSLSVRRGCADGGVNHRLPPGFPSMEGESAAISKSNPLRVGLAQTL